MPNQSVDTILNELADPNASIRDLLAVYTQAEYRPLWMQGPVLYRAFAWKMVKAGHPTQAFELVREGLFDHPHDSELKYLRALALARGGNLSKAADYAGELLGETALDLHLRGETLSLLGRLEKDRYQRAGDPRSRRRCGRRSASFYLQAYDLTGESFPGINAATLSLLTGQAAEARRLAREVIDRVGEERRQPGRSEDYWLLASLGEAYLDLGEIGLAVDWYRHAVERAAGSLGDRAAMRRQLLLLREKIDVPIELLDLFDVGTVVVFSGHMIDHPDRLKQGLAPRFPPDPRLEQLVRQAVDSQLKDLHATVGYSSAACGSDLLFAEAMLARSAELHVTLPFDRDDFYGTSVDFGIQSMQPWRERCDRALAGAIEVHHATREQYLGHDVLFEFVNSVTQGLAVTKAREIGVDPVALVVLDRTSKRLVGGTRYFLEQWARTGREARIIDLEALRVQCLQAPVSPNPPVTMSSVSASSVSPSPCPPVSLSGVSLSPSPPIPMSSVSPSPCLQVPLSASPRSQRRLQRQIKVMLFADVRNYSRLTEQQAPLFFTKFLNVVAKEIQRSERRPVFTNTWGDGLFLVFDSVTGCADFALRLLERISRMDFQKVGLPEDTAVRMGIHAGPVYPHTDPILERTNFFGTHVVRAARIEPVTTPGCAFTSEQFAALLAVETGHDFVCEYMGFEQLAKEFDRCRLYRLGRR